MGGLHLVISYPHDKGLKVGGGEGGGENCCYSLNEF